VYDWILVLHMLAIISWMAAILYLPRLFVYHAEAQKGSIQSETFKIMERRLLKAIMTPAMVVSWITGLTLVWIGGWWSGGWMWGKFLLVLGLSGAHGVLVGATRKFAEDRNDKSHVYYRVLNEVPTVLMIGIVILVIVKPF
jgi:protoporphyrinogen IX oxidase